MTNLISLCYEITSLIIKGKAVDVVFMDFSKAFDAVYHQILPEKLLKYELDEQTVRLIENWLNGKAQRVVDRVTKPSWRPVMKSVP